MSMSMVNHSGVQNLATRNRPETPIKISTGQIEVSSPQPQCRQGRPQCMAKRLRGLATYTFAISSRTSCELVEPKNSSRFKPGSSSYGYALSVARILCMNSNSRFEILTKFKLQTVKMAVGLHFKFRFEN
jgi:hypothetical protein